MTKNDDDNDAGNVPQVLSSINEISFSRPFSAHSPPKKNNNKNND